MGWLITAGILVLLSVLPLGIKAIYNTHGPLVRLIVGPVRIGLYPSKKEKKGKTNQKKEKKKKTSVSAKKGKAKEKKGGSWKEFMPLVQTVLELLDSFRKKLRVKRLELKLILAGDDPCDLAVNYGKAWAALGNLMPQLERVFIIKKRDLEVECDFTADQTLVFARLDLTITLGRLLHLIVVYGIRLLRQYLSIVKTRKGGAKL